MSANRKCRLIIGGAFVVAAFFFDWLIGSDESSPIGNYFLYHVTIPNIWRAINLPPLIIAAIVSGNPHTFSGLIVDIVFAVHGSVLATWCRFFLQAIQKSAFRRAWTV